MTALVPRSATDVQQSNTPEVSFRAKVKGNGAVEVIIAKKGENNFRISFAGEDLKPSHQVIDKRISRDILSKALISGVLEVTTNIRMVSLDIIQIRRILNA